MAKFEDRLKAFRSGTKQTETSGGAVAEKKTDTSVFGSFAERLKKFRSEPTDKSSLQGTMGTRGVPTFNDIYKYIVQETRKGNWDAAQNTERKYWERMTDVEQQKLNDYYKTTYGLVSAGAGESALTSQNVAKLPNATQKAKDKEAEKNAGWEQQKQDAKDKMNPVKFVKGLFLPDGKDGKMTLPGVMTTVGMTLNPTVTIGTLGFGAASNARKGASELKTMEQAEANADDHSTAYGGQDGYELKQTADKAALDYEDSYQTVQVRAMQLRETEGQLETAKNEYVEAEQAYLNNPTQANYNAYKSALDKYNGLVTAYDTQEAKYNADFADYKTKADAAGVAVTAYNDHITQWEKDLDKSVEEAQKKVDAARADVQAYGQLGYDSSNHSFTYASSEEALEALEVWEKELATLKGWQISRNQEEAAEELRKIPQTVKKDPEYEKFLQEGRVAQETYDTAAREINYYLTGAPAGYTYRYGSIEEAQAALELVQKIYGEMTAAPVTERNQFATDAEWNTYLYKLGKKDGSAMEYYKAIRDTLTSRAGTARTKAIEEKQGVARLAAKVWTAANEGAQSVLLNTAQHFKKEAIPTSVLQASTEEILRNSQGAERYAVMTAQQVGSMLPQLLAAYTGIGMPAAVGVSASGGAARQALSEGYSQLQARSYGLLVGVSEAVLEKLLGGVGGHLGIGPEALARRISGISSGIARFGLNLGVDMVGEIAEEEVQNFLEPALANIALGKKYEAPTAQVLLETAIVTAASTLIFSTGDAASRSKYDRNTNRLVKMGLMQEKNGEAHRLAETMQQKLKAGEEISPAEVKTLYQVTMGEINAKAGVIVRQEVETKKAASEETTSGAKKHIRMEDFTNNDSAVWNMLEYDDVETQQTITQNTHSEMVANGEVVTMPQNTIDKTAESYPDLRDMKKKDRTPILKQKIQELKQNLRAFLGGLKGTAFEFEVNGNILEAKLYDTGIKEVLDHITQDKASMLYETPQIFQNARYLYSTPDYDGDPNIYRWNYFYTPVQIGEETVGVRIAVRDMAKQRESQIYNWGIKKETALGGVGDEKNSRKPNDTSSAVSNDSIPTTSENSKEENGGTANDPSQSRQSRDSSPLRESQDDPSVGETDSSLYTREPSNGAEDEGLGRVEMVYDPELDTEIPTGITDMQEGGQAWYTLSSEDTDPVLQELRQRLLAGEITQEKYDMQAQEREAKLYEAFQKANPALFNRKGATNNGTEGKRVSDGSGQRHDGTGAGEQAGGLDGGTGKTARAEQTAKREGKGSPWDALRKNLRGKEVSAKELGVKNGTETKSLYQVPEEAYTDEMRDVSEKIEKETGKKPIFTLGSIAVETKRGIKRAKGVILGDGTVILQADHSRYTVTQLTNHELFHHKSSLNLLSVPTVMRQIREKYTGEEFSQVLGQYLQAYAGIVDIPENADAQTVEDAWNKLYEEILADAYAGINAFGAVKFSDTVSEYMAEQESVGTEQTAAATERTTGPPDALAVDDRFAVDINDVPKEIHDFVDNAVKDRKSNDEFVITTATEADNSAINRFSGPWKGKYKESPRSFSGRYVRHVLREHGNALVEMLRGQMYMSRDSIKIALSQLQEGKGRIIKGTFAERGMPSILTEIPVNGYTLYAEEPLELRTGTELEGRTMYMTPTSTTALKWSNSTSIPQRRGGASYSSISGKSRIVNGVLTGKDGSPVKLHFTEEYGTPYTARETYGAVLLCADEAAAKTVSKKNLTTQTGYVLASNPCIVTQDNPVINKEDIRNGEVAQRIAEIKEKGFDAIIMDYKGGDNYAVLVFDKSKVVSEAEYDAMMKADDQFSVDIDEDVDVGEKTDSALNGDIVPEAERDMAEQAARAQGYPVVEGVQIVPNKTYVRCTDEGRNNYGLVIGKAEPDASGREQLWVMFKNKNENKSTTAAIALSDMHPVEAMHQPTSEELESLLASEPEEVLREEAPEDYYGEDEFEGMEELEIDREALPAKAKRCIRSAENIMAASLQKLLRLPGAAKIALKEGLIRDITAEIIRTGTVSDATLEKLFEAAWKEGRETDESLSEYEDVAKWIRTVGLTIPAAERTDAAMALGFESYEQMRKSLWGKILLKKNGLPLDAAYESLREQAPVLFPQTYSAAEMMENINAAVEKIRGKEQSLDEYYGREAADAKRQYHNDFLVAAQDMAATIRMARRYTQEHLAVKDTTLPKTADILEIYRKIPEAREKARKAQARELLTAEDMALVRKILRGDMDISQLDPNTDNVEGITNVVEASREYEEYAAAIRDYKSAIRAKRNATMDDLLRNIMGFKDKKGGIWYATETPVRNIRDVAPDEETAERILDVLHRQLDHAEAEANRDLKRYRARIAALGIKTRAAKGDAVSETAAVQIYGEATDAIARIQESGGKLKEWEGETLADWEGMIADFWLNSPSLDKGKIESAVTAFREVYNELFDRMNEARVRNGYEPIPFRRGYFPHFQIDGRDGLLQKFKRYLGIESKVLTLPTEIAGRTAGFKPGIRWFGHGQQRQGVNTEYNALQGMELYLTGALDVIHKTDHIQNLRAFAQAIRRNTAPEAIQAKIDEIREDVTLTEDEKDIQIQEQLKDRPYALSNFAQHIDELANTIAGKKSFGDREVERMFGRETAYNVLKAANNRFASNAVVANVSSALTNVIPLFQAAPEVGTGRVLWGMKETVRDYFARLSGAERDGMDGKMGAFLERWFGESDDIRERSDFLANRHGSDPLYQTGQQKWGNKFNVLMEFFDTIAADSLVRARYKQNIKRGMSEELSLQEAGEWAAGLMAARNKSAMPTIFHQQNALVKMFTQFQLEVNNTWRHKFKDLPREAKKQGRKYIAMLLQGLLASWLYNELTEKLVGRRSAEDPVDILNEFAGDLTGYQLPNMFDLGGAVIECIAESDWSEFDRVFATEQEDVGTALVNLGSNAAAELPFVGNLAGGGRIPVSDMLPDVPSLISTLFDPDKTWSKKGVTAAKELAQPLLYTMLPFGAGQLKKTAQGLISTAMGGSYTLNNDGEREMQYPVFNDNPLAWFHAGIFGKSATEGAQDWVDSGFRGFSAAQTAAYEGAVEAGTSQQEAYELINALRNTKKTNNHSQAYLQREALLDADIPDKAKEAIYTAMLSDEQSEKIEAFRSAGLGFDDYLEAYNAKADIDDMDLSAGEKAREFSRWVNKQGYTDKQASAIKDTLVFYSMVPGEAGYYDKFVGAGVSDELAYQVAQSFDKLEPKAGETQVSDMQKYRVVVDSTDSVSEQIKILGQVMHPSTYKKLTALSDYHVTPKVYVTAREMLAKCDADGNGSYTQAEIRMCLNAMPHLSTEARAALWQVLTGSKSEKNNPYSKAVGKMILGAAK